MYRLLRRYTLPLHNRKLATIQINLEQTSQVCSFCSYNHLTRIKSRSCIVVKDVLPDCSYSALRYQSTNTHTAFLADRETKKIKRKTRKYAELLEVSDETTTNTKATIKKLTAASVSTLANQPEISLDQLHKIQQTNKLPIYKKSEADNKRDKVQTGSRNSVRFEEDALDMSVRSLEGNILPEDENSIHDDPMVLGSTDQATFIRNASFFNTLEKLPKEIEDENLDSTDVPVIPSEKVTKKKRRANLKSQEKNAAIEKEMRELERRSKEESLRRSLHSYLDVCINCGMSSQAFHTLLYYRNRGKRCEQSNSPRILEVALYNCVLHGFASICNLNGIKEALKIMKEDSIKPNPQTYAAIFECIGRMELSRDFRKFLQTVHSEMTDRGISLQDLFGKTSFAYNQRQMVMRGVSIIDPNFRASYTVPETSYTHHLLHKISSTPRKPVSPAEGLFTFSELCELGQRQMELESDGRITVKSIAAHGEATKLALHCREKITAIQDMWKQVIRDAFRRDVAVLKKQYSSGSGMQRSINIYPYLKVLDEHHYVDAISNEIRQLASGSETFSPSLNFLTRQLGQTIFQKYQIEMKTRNGVRNKMKRIYDKYCDHYINGSNGMNTRSTWQNLIHEESHEGPTIDKETTQWPSTILGSVGRFLYNIIMRDIKIDVNALKMSSKTERYLPAFYVVFRNNRHMITQEIKPHPTISRLYREAQLEDLFFHPAQLPLISPAVPWSSIRNGGYLISEVKIIRLSYQAVQQWKRFEDAPEQQLYPVLDSLNQLSSIPWKVNNSVLDIALRTFQSGGAKHLDIPEPPSHDLTPIFIPTDASIEERNEAVKKRFKEKKDRADMYSLWCEALYRLSLANHYKDQVFWLPHSMDFRGRVYPIPPHVNHLGSDLARSLMVFALGKPLGPDGLDWLKIHIINLTGLKKRESNRERLNYANEILPKILDSAENPLTGEKWWQESEEPWQTLAAAFEIAQALKSPDPAKYISHFPVHQDGSCNGLQHYAALGRDQQGARSVNLSSSSKPQDVYSSIAALVEKERKADADAGLQIALALDGLIKRKVIKQTVMTTVYGVTRFGARLQIARQLREIDFPDQYLWQGSHYLVDKTFHSLREMFTSAKSIQDWLTDCARLIAMVRGKNVEWITPLGLPVVQPYSKNVHQIGGNISKLDHHLVMDMFEKPNVMKQKNAFPPNFIHSLDSSHMMLTSLHCEHAGLTFVSVHDCFWTHACTVPAMNKICREEFVALHSEPILQSLSKFLTEKFSYEESELRDDGSVTELTKTKLNKILKRVPKQGDFELGDVLKSVYFFS